MTRPQPSGLAEDVRALLDDHACIRLPVGLVAASGADTIDYLQTKLTCDTRRWSETGGSRGIATDINGRIVGDALWHRTTTGALAVLIGGDPEPLHAHLDRYVILEDVALEAGRGHALFLFGEQAADALQAATGRQPDTRALDDGVPRLARTRILRREALVAIGEPDALDALSQALAQAGLPTVSPDAFHAAEVLACAPRQELDLFPAETIPLEAGLWDAVSFNKGCYLGQEVIERLFSRGRPNKRLCLLTWHGEPVPPRHGLRADGREAGFVTRCVPLDDGRVAALAYVRRRALDDEQPLSLEDREAPVTRHAIVGGATPAHEATDVWA